MNNQPHAKPDDARAPELAQRGEKRAAIVRYRELTGAGQLEAKDAVDAL